MKANELRIGNYVYELLVKDNCFVNTEIQLHTVGEYVISSVEKGRAMPIPLTEEWLLKFGFIDDNKEEREKYPRVFTHKSYVLNKFGIVYEMDKSKYTLTDSIGFELGEFSVFLNQCFVKSIRYVHQLQNLYFIITGEELTLKQ
jgi:hypothetical protein